MNPQISFIMSDSDEKEFVDFIYKNDCTLLKTVLFENEKPGDLCECKDVYSCYYHIADKNYKADYEYTQTEFEVTNVDVKAFVALDEDYAPKPVIEFIRGRFNISVGRLYVNADRMSPEDKEFVMSKYKVFKKWIKKNSNHVARMGLFYNVYFLPGATQEYMENGCPLLP